MTENSEGDLTNYWWEIINGSGCSDIQDAIRGRKPGDFDPKTLEWMADFVLTTPSDYQPHLKLKNYLLYQNQKKNKSN
jgi:hypothetical protein